MAETYNVGDPNCPSAIEAQLQRIEDALKSCGALATADSPCAAVAYYDKGEALPWRVSDDYASMSFATVREAVDFAEEWYDEE